MFLRSIERFFFLFILFNCILVADWVLRWNDLQRAYDNFPFSDDFSSLDVPKDDFILWTSRLDADHQAIKYVLNEQRKKNANTKKFLSGLSIDSLKTKKMDIFGVRDCEDEKTFCLTLITKLKMHFIWSEKFKKQLNNPIECQQTDRETFNWIRLNADQEVFIISDLCWI